MGITYSHTHAQGLGLPPETLIRACSMGFSHIRLCCYWNRIEKSPGIYDFSEMESYITMCQRSKQNVVLCIGMKAPRWPEFHIPSFYTYPQAQKAVFPFLKATIRFFSRYSCITHWQVENEPLDESGPQNQVVPYPLLAEEVMQVRTHDARPIILTAWGNDYAQRDFLSSLASIGDVIGIDLYSRQHFRSEDSHGYRGPQISYKEMRRSLSSFSPYWITELQAEPWEGSKAAYRSKETPSSTPKLLRQTLQEAQQLEAQEILLWGFEYWAWKDKNGDSRYMKLVSDIVHNGV